MADDESTRKPWGDDFDEERAWTLVQALRADKAALKSERDQARADKASAEKERDQAVADSSQAKKDLAADRRDAILKEFSIDPDDAEEFLPDGLGLEELRRKAERLAKRKSDDKAEEPKEPAPPKEDDAQAGAAPSGADDAPEGSTPPLPDRPKPKLQSGAGAPADGSDLDLDAIASAARRR